jgi:hypothetical protein
MRSLLDEDLVEMGFLVLFLPIWAPIWCLGLLAAVLMRAAGWIVYRITR